MFTICSSAGPESIRIAHDVIRKAQHPRTGRARAVTPRGPQGGFPVYFQRCVRAFRLAPVRAPYRGRLSQREMTPMMPSRNSSTAMMKIVPWITVTQAPTVAK